MNSVVIRPGKLRDYPEFLEAEQIAWAGTHVPLITLDQFASWLSVFPEGLLVADLDGKVCGHVFSQICMFDPYDETDNRGWEAATDFGFIRKTHDPRGSTMYNVSVSSCKPGAGKKLLRAAFHQAESRNLQYYAGASSIPGVAEWAASQRRVLDRSCVEDYVSGCLRKLRRRPGPGHQLRDPVISVTLSIEGTEYVRLIENYFDYPGSAGWAALIAYQCKKVLACP